MTCEFAWEMTTDFWHTGQIVNLDDDDVADMEDRFALDLDVGLGVDLDLTNCCMNLADFAVDFARDGDVYVLQVSDDGIGDPALGRSDARPRLVEIMVRQMGGRIEVSREEGFRVRIEIPGGADVHLPAA